MTKSLTTVEQRDITFYKDTLTAVRTQDGTIYVPLRPIVEQLGLSWPSQSRRVRQDLILSDVAQRVAVTTTHRGDQHMLCLPLDYLPGFLFTISARRVSDEIRPRVLRYQRECHKVLAQAFTDGQLTTEPSFDDLLKTESPSVQAYKMIMAMASMARQQILIESAVTHNSEQIQGALERITTLESTLHDPQRTITDAQASQVSQAVKAVALTLGQRTGRNEFGGVYGELYRRYDITGYKKLPAAKFEPAINFLNQWLQSLNDNDAPF